jgi:hypothetical protein
VDLFRRRLILMPKASTGGDLHVRTEHFPARVDWVVPARPHKHLGQLADVLPDAIGWADKRFVVVRASDSR